MIRHIDIGNSPQDRKHEVGKLIRNGKIKFGGYSKTKIYGLLLCSSGKRMKIENRVFFENEQEAIDAGYRPCGHCMPKEYKQWKESHKK